MKKLLLLLTFISLAYVGAGQTQGDILITEYMADPTDVDDSNGEYFELYNTTGSNIDIDGWTIKDDGSDSFNISGTLVIPAFDFIVIGKGDGSYNGRDYEMTGMTLANNDDEIVLEKPDGTEICRINYTDGNQFEPASCELNNISNHTGGVTSESDYVAATDALSENDKGSPGSAGNTIGTGGGSDPEPSNHVNNFTAFVNGSNQIDLSWSDNDGTQSADGFLIKANTTGSFSAPSDGTDPNEDFDLSDSSAIVKVNHGIESHSFTGLSASTQYYFKIWPYTNSGSSIDFKIDGTVPTDNATTSVAAAIVINEILADPDATNGDANGDGTVNTGDDEFVELYNNSSDAINISGYTIHDGVGEKHVFPNGTYIQPHDVIVVFAGGTPTGFDNLDVQTSSSGQLSLNNSGDDVILKDASNTEVTSVAYGSEGEDNQSLVRDPIATGSFVKHTNATGASGAIFSPAKNIDGSYVKIPTVWYGTAKSDSWETAGNWSNGTPDGNYRVAIPSSLSTYPTISADATVNSIVIDNGATLVGQENLTVNGTITTNKSFLGYSAVDAVDGWYAISSPVSSMTIAGSDFEPGANDDLYEYDENGNMWLNYTGGTFGDTDFLAGKGYLVSYETTATKSFEGTAFNADGVSATLGETNTKWNLVGNPYPSKLTYANINATNISSPKSLNESTGAWDDITGGEVEVGEGIFVYAEGSSSLTFNLDDQTHGSGKKASPSYAFLRANFDDGLSVFARFGTNPSASKNYEWKYDSRYLYPATSIPYLSTITDDEVMASTYVFNDEEESVIVPLYFSVNSEREITLSTDGNIGYQMAVEDNIDGSITEIDADNPFVFTALPADADDRFNLHLTKASTIGLDENEELSGVHVYANKRNIYFNADENLANATLTVYNTIGQVVLTTNVESGSEIIRMDDRGAYIVKVQSNEGSLTEKIIIQ